MKVAIMGSADAPCATVLKFPAAGHELVCIVATKEATEHRMAKAFFGLAVEFWGALAHGAGFFKLIVGQK